MERRIRNSAKALIIKDGKMLANKINDNRDIFYIMIGSGQLMMKWNIKFNYLCLL